MKHKHCDKIVAKSENKHLVQFIKMNGEWEDAGLSDKFISFSEEYDYFLCLPQHKEACLHWLNGGKAEENYKSEWSDIEHHEWHEQSVFNFDDGYTIRIKPKKDKRWIGVYGNHVTEAHFETLDKARAFINGCPSLYSKLVPDNWQFIEIEVEV